MPRPLLPPSPPGPIRRRSRPLLAALGVVVIALLGPGCGLLEVEGDGAAQQAVDTGSPARPGDDTGAADGIDTAATTTTQPAPPLSEAFSAIAERTTMTEEARDVLARSSPELVDRSTLGADCTLDPELSVLGCYRDGRIAVLQVTDPRLDGMTETTTAHEMLHAAWAELDEGQRTELAGLLQAAYERVADEELRSRIDAYAARDPGVVDNELHSILGTETADLGPELEDYYARWFTDRQQVVTLATATRQTFTDLQAQVDELDTRLAELRTGIEEGEQALAEERDLIEAESAELDALREAGEIDDYNAGVDPFNQRVSDYNQAVVDHEALVTEHNELVTERNELASAYTDLAGQVTTTAESMPE